MPGTPGLLSELWQHKDVQYTTELSFQTNYTYDENDRLISETKYSVKYSGTGEEKQKELDEIVLTIAYSYNAQGQMIKATRTDSNGTVDTVYTYDAKGNLISEVGVDKDGTPCSITYEYNENGQITKRTTTYTSTPKTVYVLAKKSEVISRTSTFTYNEIGRLVLENEVVSKTGNVETKIEYQYEKYQLYYNPYN